MRAAVASAPFNADDDAAGDFLKVSLAIKDGIAQERFQTLRFSKRPAS